MPAFHSATILIDHFVESLESTYQRMYGGAGSEYQSVVRTAAITAMEIIGNSNALFHNAEHSMMVTLVGQEILRGKFLRDGDVEPREWVHFIVSLLCHDIGYVRGICPGDRENIAVVDESGNTVMIPPAATDAFLTPYHIERGKLFVKWRFRDHPVIDPGIITTNLENTQFPVPEGTDSMLAGDYPGLIRAADLIGQLADPNYLRKLPALFFEFEENGANKIFGYETPEDLRENYPAFYWKMVSQHVAKGIDYLRVTREGREWEAGLYSHVFAQEHRQHL
jgi:hypothetical protein